MDLQKVLIVDQDPDDIELLNEALLETIPQVDITIADSCDAFIEKITQKKPDLVFLEPYLPPENAARCLEAIRKSPEFSRTIVVILSGYFSGEEADYYLTNGANYFYVKPSSWHELREIIEIVYRTNRHKLAGPDQ